MEQKTLKLTIAIPTYNRAEYLGRAIDSVLGQITPEVELLISDNASEDDTEALVHKKMEMNDGIRYIRNSENLGSDANFLQCFREAKGDYILLLGNDDLIAEGGIKTILAFLERQSDTTIVFLNHAFFKHEYHGLTDCFSRYLERTEGTIVTEDKKEFVKYCRQEFTYMSSFLLSKAAFDTVETPERYCGTYFIHTCVAIEAAKNKHTKLAVLFPICVCKDNTPRILETEKDFSTFRIFGEGMEYTFCTVSKEFDFASKKMRKIYVKWIARCWRGTIVKLKAEGDVNGKEQFKSYGMPVLKKHFSLRIRLMPYYLMPSWFAKWVYKNIRPIYKKIKGDRI